MVAVRFAQRIIASQRIAIEEAADLANVNESPVAVWERDGWFTVCDVPPDDMDYDPTEHGWTMCALVDPESWREESR